VNSKKKIYYTFIFLRVWRKVVDLNKHWRFETASSELTVTLNYGVVEVVEWKPIE